MMMIFLTNSLTRDRCNAGPIFKTSTAMKKIYSTLHRHFVPQLKADRELRPALTGVYHKGGYIYATTGFILARVVGEYPEELEGKAINKQGEELESRYPNAEAVIPDYLHAEKVEIDLGDLKKAVKNVLRVKNKTRTETKHAAIDLFGEGTHFFQAPILDGMIRLFAVLKEDFEILRYRGSKDNHNSLLFVSENHLFDDRFPLSLAMPITGVAPADGDGRPLFSLEEALNYQPESKPTNKAWYD
jgi:hypothetical protein